MATISLNIYKEGSKNEIEKTYTVEGYDLMLGTIDDFMAIIDPEKITDEKAIAAMIVRSYGQVKPLLLDIFPGVTSEELNRTKVKELVYTLIQVGQAIMEDFKIFKSKN